ncbi:MAG: hypothetical protein ACLQHK_02950 [Gallionellaceae bacterium]
MKRFELWLVQALKANSHRPKRDRRTALILFETIQKQGFAGHYCRITEFVRDWREHGDGAVAKSALVPLKFQLGESSHFRLPVPTEQIQQGIQNHHSLVHLSTAA